MIASLDLPQTDFDGAAFGRWTIGGLCALTVHCAVAFVLTHREPVPDPADPPAAIVIELEAAPAPPMPVQTVATPPSPAVEPIEEPEPEVLPEEEPEVVEEPPPEDPPEEIMEPETDEQVVVSRVPQARPDYRPLKKEPPPVRPERPKRAEAKKRPAPSAAQASAPRRQARASAPNAGANNGRPTASPQQWQSAVFRHLERHKRYPRDAGRAGGTVRVRFTVDARGGVLGAKLVASSGHAALDQAAVELLRRASPIPAPPPNVFRPGLSIEVPIRFSVR